MFTSGALVDRRLKQIHKVPEKTQSHLVSRGFISTREIRDADADLHPLSARFLFIADIHRCDPGAGPKHSQGTV